jgi:hypothetical protein
MDGYDLLRKKAAEKLDQAIQAARREYRDTLQKIDALRRELGDEPPATHTMRLHETALDAVRRYMPRDRTFSVAEMIQILADSEPETHRTRAAVKTSLYKLEDIGELRRIAKDGKGHVLWASIDSGVEHKPYASMPLSDVVAEVLEVSAPMRPTEIVVAIQRLGCRAEQHPPDVLRNVRKALYANPRRFKHDGDQRWSLV